MTENRPDRRSAPRYAFVAAIEVVEPHSGREIVTLTADLSRHGCHVGTNTPFEAGTAVLLNIRRGGQTFHATGKIAYSIAAKAMGVAFQEIDADGAAILDRWLVDANRSDANLRGERRSAIASDRRLILAVCVLIVAGLTAGALAWLGML